MIFLWLLLLGVFTHYIVQRSVASITRTPIWILWLVMMIPAFVWTAWIQIYGENEPMPPLLLVGLFVTCPVLYWFLIQWGRSPTSKPTQVKAQSQNAQLQDKLVQDKLESTTPNGDVAADKKSALRPINKEEEANLQNCFPWSVYYLQNIEYRPQAVICRGQLRTSPEVAYKTIQENVEAQFGDRFLILFQEGLNGKPFFALVPNPQAQVAAKQGTEKLTRPVLALGLVLATLLTTTVAGVAIVGVTEEQLQANPSLLLSGLPYALALMVILGIHESGHYLAARLYRIRTTLPYFIPIPLFLGTFGAFIQIKSPVPNRKALFDIGIAGPLSGLVATLPLLVWGLAHSELVQLDETSGMLDFNSFNPSSSLMLALLSKLALGNQLTATNAIHLHPVAVAGCLGLVVTALNLMPVGQLDGGHIVHAMFGQRVGAAIGQVARLLVLALSLVQRELLLWAILLFFIPVVDEPALNDVSELDDRRDIWGLVALSLLVMIILPAPRSLTQVLF